MIYPIDPSRKSSAEVPVGAPTSEDLFLVAMAFYLNGVHKIVIQSWRKFSETLQATAQANSRAHRVCTIRHQQQEGDRLEGERRQMKVLNHHLDNRTFVALYSSI